MKKWINYLQYKKYMKHTVQLQNNRIEMGVFEAKVISSNGAKEYTVRWDNNIYTSNDDASYWQGYPGYPMIAILMLQGKLSLNKKLLTILRIYNWTELNNKYKKKYDKAVEEIMDRLKEEKVDCYVINEEIIKVFEEIKKLDITTKRSSIKVVKRIIE